MVVIVDWLYKYFIFVFSKVEFDMLIWEGFVEWRNLCIVEVFKDWFFDKYFDLDIVI